MGILTWVIIKITNVKKGTAPTDAANVGQLTKVTSNNHSVVINKTTDANGAPVYDLAVTGTPGAPAADPRVDMLGEEIGRVGAQGAALSALKLSNTTIRTNSNRWLLW